MFITRRDMNVAMGGLGEKEPVTVSSKGVVVRGKTPHWLVQTVVGSVVSTIIFITIVKKCM